MLDEDAQRLARYLAGQPLSWWRGAGREAAVRDLLDELARLGRAADDLPPLPFLPPDLIPVSALSDMLLVLVADVLVTGDGAAAEDALRAVRRTRDALAVRLV